MALDSIEYHRRNSDAHSYFPPFRYPGQYADEETGLFENWNRYYDPDTGRYLAPEPLAQSPEYLAAITYKAQVAPLYGYAFNNPLSFIDPNGETGEAAFVEEVVFPALRLIPGLKELIPSIELPPLDPISALLWPSSTAADQGMHSTQGPIWWDVSAATPTTCEMAWDPPIDLELRQECNKKADQAFRLCVKDMAGRVTYRECNQEAKVCKYSCMSGTIPRTRDCYGRPWKF